MKPAKKERNHLRSRWRRYTALALLPVLLLCSGCWNQVEVVNTVEAVGILFDLEDGRPLFAVQLAQPASSQAGTQPQKPVNYYSVGATFSEAARRIMLEVPRLPIWAHTGVMLMGTGLTNHDLAVLADFLARNRNVRKTSLLFVAKGSPSKDFMEAELPIEAYPLMGLRKLIRIQEQQIGIYKSITIDDFLQDLTEAGIEPTVPQVVVKDSEGKKILGLQGTAVFKGRRQVGELDERESRGYRLLSPSIVTGGLLTFPPPGAEGADNGRYISIELTRSRATIKPQIEGGSIKRVTISIDAEGNFYEQNFVGQIISLENMANIEDATGEEIKRSVTAAIAKAQVLQSDIFGWGRMVRRQDPPLWEQIGDDWPAIFSSLEIEVRVDFAIRRTYLLDHSFEFLE